MGQGRKAACGMPEWNDLANVHTRWPSWWRRELRDGGKHVGVWGLLRRTGEQGAEDEDEKGHRPHTCSQGPADGHRDGREMGNVTCCRKTKETRVDECHWHFAVGRPLVASA